MQPESRPLADPAVHVVSSALDAAIERSQAIAKTWLESSADCSAAPSERLLLSVPDVGPACEAILADQLFHDLTRAETRGLLTWIRSQQDGSGAWLDVDGQPDLSLTTLGWWACVQAGVDPRSERLVRAARMVLSLGGAQRANFDVRLWLAMAGVIPWGWLPAMPAELWLMPSGAPMSPTRFAPWSRAMLTPYLLLARAPARLHLVDASDLLLRRGDGNLIAPRLTRPGLAGDLLQAFDLTVKLSRKLPRGPLPRIATNRALRWIDRSQQSHGGWFSTRPTILSLLALRVAGASSDDPRIRRGLNYLRAARGRVEVDGEGTLAIAQGLSGTPLGLWAGLLNGSETDDARLGWLLRQELSEAGPWQHLADAPAGGWPTEGGARSHLDARATCGVLDSIDALPEQSLHAAPAWAKTRRATDVLLAMQEPDGSISRFERGEAHVPMRRLPWQDADLLAFGRPDDEGRVYLCAAALTQLARAGFRSDDDRLQRSMRWLETRVGRDLPLFSLETVAALARSVGRLCTTRDPLRQRVEHCLRGRQHEDGSFGTVVDTGRALTALLDLGETCVQAKRAARFLCEGLRRDLEPEHGTTPGLGLSPMCIDPSAGPREGAQALRRFVRAGGTLSEAKP